MKIKGYILFDIDGVIRDVTNSYRLAIQQTVKNYIGWIPPMEVIDNLKSEGSWNNDWDVSLEIIKRRQQKLENRFLLPSRKDIIKTFGNFYFGGDLKDDYRNWKGFIKDEELLVNKDFFKVITSLNIKWGFVSGAEKPSAKYLLEDRLGLKNPPLIVMGDAPEKPNPKGFLTLVGKLAECPINCIDKPIAYVGDTVADVLTIKNARKRFPKQQFYSFAVAPPHLHKANKKIHRNNYEKQLIDTGADFILEKTIDLLKNIDKW